MSIDEECALIDKICGMEDEEHRRSKRAVQVAISTLVMAQAMTGGAFMESLFPEPKLRSREICPKCRNNRSGFEHVCRAATKTFAKCTEIVIINCSSFECEQESGTEEIREGAPESFSETGGNKVDGKQE